MHAESAPRFRRDRLSSWLIVAAVTFLLVSLGLLAAGVLLADVLERPAEPLLLGPFRWHSLAIRVA